MTNELALLVDQETEAILELEKSLWQAADKLRANSKLTATEYSMPVLGIIFLRFAFKRFETVREKVESSLPEVPGRGKRPLTKEDFLSEKAIFLPEKARFNYLIDLPENADLGSSINDAMKIIEAEYPDLESVLPKNYNEFENDLLEELLRILNRDSINNIPGDAFGKIYEYFLNEFAISGAQEGGEFFTPLSLVQTIVNIIKPNQGVILDPACGSAGMFVQTGHFLEEEGVNPSEKITIYGQEKTTTNTKIAKMNLAVHGLELKNIAETNSFYNDYFTLAGKCDFVMANPPFNVDGVEKHKESVKNDPRLLYTTDEGGSKVRLLPKNDNANYLWIQYFYGYLNETGRAGFVMASSASDAGHSEKDIREKLVKTGAVDVMVSIGTNFFYTRSLPCTLWFFDRAKEKDEQRSQQILMLDARNIFRKVTRKIHDFTPEQLKNITVIVDLYRGDRNSLIKTVQLYIDNTNKLLKAVPDASAEFVKAYKELMKLFPAYFTSGISTTDETKSLHDELTAELKKLTNEVKTADKLIVDKLSLTEKEIDAADTAKANKAQHKVYSILDELTQQLKSLHKSVENNAKLQGALTDTVLKELSEHEKDNGKNGRPKEWKSVEIRKLRLAIDATKKFLFTIIKQASYYHNQIKWLQSRFPNAEFTDVEGLCKIVSLDEVAANDYSLTPGRYVGVAPRIEDDFDFEERMAEIKVELEGLNDEAAELASQISANLEELGI